MLRSVHDRAELAALLRKDAAPHAYQLGDLDDFFWPFTTWYARGETVALIYHGQPTPTLLAFGPDEPLRDAAIAGRRASAVRRVSRRPGRKA
jgi:hypothetical protein